MKKQEETKQAELSSKTAEFKAMQAQAETVSEFPDYIYFMTKEIVRGSSHLSEIWSMKRTS